MLVSNTIYSPKDAEAAYECYKGLYDDGVEFYETELDTYTYSHQKYWILDDHEVWLSTGNWSPTDYPGEGGKVVPHHGIHILGIPSVWI